MPLNLPLTRRTLFGVHFAVSFLAFTPFALAADPQPSATPLNFQSDIRPVLEAACLKCHGATKKKGGIDFSTVADDRSARKKMKVWRLAIEQVTAKQMPPEDEARQLTPVERDRLLAWMNRSVVADCSDQSLRDPGPSVVHRLNLYEYNNTVHDLLGIDFDAAEAIGMPDDAVNGSYGKLAAGLNLSSALMDKYFGAADKILDRLFGTELATIYNGDITEHAKHAREKLLAPKTASGVSDHDAAKQILSRLLRRAYRRPIESTEIEALVALFDAGIAKKLDFETALRLPIKAILVSPHFLLRLESDRAPQGSSEAYRVSDHELASRLSYFLWSSMPDDELLDLADRGKLSADGPSAEAVRLSGTVIGSAGSDKPDHANRDKVFDGDENTVFDNNLPGLWMGLDFGAPKKVTRVRFVPRKGQEHRMVGGKFQAADNADFTAGLIELFTIAEKPSAGMTARDVDVSSAKQFVRYVPPENSWGNVAEVEFRGIVEGTVLEQQVRRMLVDPKARALTEQFAARWLGASRLFSARPSTEFFPNFNGELKKAMFDEITTFFDHLRTEDRSVIELLDANYTYLNAELAKHYGISGIEGKEIRRVELKPEYHRGGLLGMGAMLAVTSHTNRTSPTLRGKWVLDTIFGTPPPPPPANAGVIDEKQDKSKAKSFRELLNLHASQPACAACHKKMDPLGFALDNFDAVGAWRDKAGDQPLDTTGVLPTGESLTGVADLKGVLLKRQDEFERNLIEQLTIYGLGREIEYYDQCVVQQTQRTMAGNGHKFSTMIMEVVKSYPFQYRKNSDAP